MFQHQQRLEVRGAFHLQESYTGMKTQKHCIKPLSCTIGKEGKQTIWNVEELRRYLAITTDTMFYIKTEAGEEVPMLVERLRQALALQSDVRLPE